MNPFGLDLTPQEERDIRHLRTVLISGAIGILLFWGLSAGASVPEWIQGVGVLVGGVALMVYAFWSGKRLESRIMDRLSRANKRPEQDV